MPAANAAFAESKISVESLRVLRMEPELVLEFEADVSLHQQRKLAAKITPLGTSRGNGRSKSSASTMRGQEKRWSPSMKQSILLDP
jgi:hypothetical protein